MTTTARTEKGKKMLYRNEEGRWILSTNNPDVVEVVRCKNCKYLQEDECPWTGVIDLNGYCSRGERKEDGRDQVENR